MTVRKVSLRIQGDFVDSFIYSGTIFLVDSNSVIKTYDWEHLVVSALKVFSHRYKNALYAFLTDCRKEFSTDIGTLATLDIDEAELEKAGRGTYQLEGWPTDINVYSNNLFISSEHGVTQVPFVLGSKSLDYEKKTSLWHQYAYKIAPSDGRRVAIAAGIEGLVTAYPEKKGKSPNNIAKKLIENETYDCDWVGSQLITNSEDGPFSSIYASMPKKDAAIDTGSNFFSRYNAARLALPATKKIQLRDGRSPNYAWAAGNRVFATDQAGRIYVDGIVVSTLPNFSNAAEGEAHPNDSISLSAARSGVFGTIAEGRDSLYKLSTEGNSLISSDFVSWRTFPRARNYLNHIHVVENDSLLIEAYAPEYDSCADQFCVSLTEALQYLEDQI